MERTILNRFKQIKKLIGNTPLVQIFYKFRGKKSSMFAKLEWYNLTGSIKDRVAYQIMFDAYNQGAITQKSKVYEITSGNMGISIAGVCNLLGNECEIIMPKSMSEERKKLIKLYGAKLTLVDDFKQGFVISKQLERQGEFLAHQFENQSNFNAHYNSTAKEIFKKLNDKKINSFVAGVGTSGTLMGVGAYLKEHASCQVVGIEPENARILTNKCPFLPHKIQGLSDQKLPELYNENLVDQVIQIRDNDAIKMAQKLCQKFSLGVGISSGANFLGCVLKGDKSVTTFADDNKKYLSTDLTNLVSSQLVDEIELIDIKVL